MTNLKLGKRAAKKDKRTLKLSNYIVHLPPAPQSVDLSHGIDDWGLMLNDEIGDCTCAAIGHMIQCWTANTTGEITLADSEILDAYRTFCGYDPLDPNSDQGGVELDVLNRWRKNGGFGGHNLIAYADPEPRNLVHVHQGLALFGGMYIGLSLPISAQSQDIWDVVGDPRRDFESSPGSWGGHAVSLIGYDAKHLKFVTWGKIKLMTPAFWVTYCDESHALLSQDWLAHFGGNADRIRAALLHDLIAVTN